MIEGIKRTNPTANTITWENIPLGRPFIDGNFQKYSHYYVKIQNFGILRISKSGDDWCIEVCNPIKEFSSSWYETLSFANVEFTFTFK